MNQFQIMQGLHQWKQILKQNYFVCFLINSSYLLNDPCSLKSTFFSTLQKLKMRTFFSQKLIFNTFLKIMKMVILKMKLIIMMIIIRQMFGFCQRAKKLWNMKVIMIPIVVCVPKAWKKSQKELEIRGKIYTIQTTVLLRFSRMLKRILET